MRSRTQTTHKGGVAWQPAVLLNPRRAEMTPRARARVWPRPSRPPLAIGRRGAGGGPRPLGGASGGRGHVTWAPRLPEADVGGHAQVGERGGLCVAGWPACWGAGLAGGPGRAAARGRRGGTRGGPRRPSPRGGPAVAASEPWAASRFLSRRSAWLPPPLPAAAPGGGRPPARPQAPARGASRGEGWRTRIPKGGTE